jgi:hypothetical protein
MAWHLDLERTYLVPDLVRAQEKEEVSGMHLPFDSRVRLISRGSRPDLERLVGAIDTQVYAASSVYFVGCV